MRAHPSCLASSILFASLLRAVGDLLQPIQSAGCPTLLLCLTLTRMCGMPQLGQLLV